MFAPTVSSNESVSLLGSSLEVLEELVDHYMHTHEIIAPKIPTLDSSDSLQNTFNSIYSKVK